MYICNISNAKDTREKRKGTGEEFFIIFYNIFWRFFVYIIFMNGK